MLVGPLLLAALALAWANGANDNFKATATVYGAGAMDYARARRLATAAQLAGSLASVVLADALLRAFSGKGLVPPEVVGDPRFLAAVGTGAAATVLIATRVGLPISIGKLPARKQRLVAFGLDAHVKTMELMRAGKPAAQVVEQYEAFVKRSGFAK